MKVLVVNTVRFRLNGITSVIMNYYRNMDLSDVQMDFVVINEISDEYKAELINNGSHFYKLPRKSNPIIYMRELRKLLKQEKYDVIHVHGNSSMMILDLLPAYLEKVPLRIAHSHNTTCTHLKLHRLLKPLFKKCYNCGLACGQEAGKWLFDHNDFIEVKNGIDLDKYRYNEEIREEYRQKLGIKKDEILLGHIGNFIEQKNHEFLIDVFNDLCLKNDNYKLLLISDGALLDEIKSKVDVLHLNEKVIFLGKTTEPEKYLQAMDMFVLPSKYEGLPVVLVEAQAAGLSCLVADTVAREADLTDTLIFLPIQDTAIWVSEIEKQAQRTKTFVRVDECIKWNQKIKEAGYDIKENANYMCSIYKKVCEKC